MADDDAVMGIELTPNPNMSKGDYIKWNLEGATRILTKRPWDYEITTMVYNIHKEILRSRGATDADFAEGDKFINGLVKVIKDAIEKHQQPLG